MPQADLSTEQAQILDPTIRVVEAGPGSGKTRAIVARFMQSTATTPRGVALVSFTNAAVDEVRRRAGSTPHVLHAPHFVGTIDSFLHRFIVTPAEVARLGHLPSYRPSWDSLPPDLATVRLNGIRGAGIRLSAFRMDKSSQVLLGDSSLIWQERQYLQAVDAANQRQRLLNRAGSIIRGLNTSGVYDANTARVQAFRILEGPSGSAVVSRITTRFAELLVDEAQDCDEAEMAVINQLTHDLHVVLVADPDQAIYEFRGSNPELFTTYRDEQNPAERVDLTVNYRSSQAICQTVAEIRAAGTATITASSPGPCPPVHVLGGSAAEQREKFLIILGQHGIDDTEAAVLAHSRAYAAEAAGSTPPAGSSTAKGNRLAGACCVLRQSSATPSERLEAITQIEDLILALIVWPEAEAAARGRERQLELLERRPDWVRHAAGRCLSKLGAPDTREEFGLIARQALGEILSPLSLDHLPLGNQVKKPDQAVWEQCLSHNQSSGRLAAHTIHAAKGSEFTAVLVALPTTLIKTDGRDVLDDWEADLNTEPRRVLYVAVSRARELLAIGAGLHQDRVASLLEAAGAAVTRD